MYVNADMRPQNRRVASYYNPVLLLILATTKYHCCYDYKMTYYLV